MLPYFRARLPEAIIGNVRHGLIAKRGLERRPRDRSARIFDFICVGDDGTVERYRRSDAEPSEIWLTGYSQLDALVAGHPAPDLGLDRSQPTILYAPTWNRRLSSAPMLGPALVDLIRGDGPAHNVIIKPHPVTPDLRPEWMRWWDTLAATDERVRLLDPRADVTGPMLAADLMISDASSTIFEFVALDRPIVLVTNPEAPRDRDYDAADLPWRWRDVGAEVTDRESLATVVREELARPDARSAIRRRYADELFGEFRDGGNSGRIADRLVDLAARIERGEVSPAVRASSRWAADRRPKRRLSSRLRRLARGWLTGGARTKSAVPARDETRR